MGEHGDRLGLLVEAAAELRVGGQVLFQNLDGHETVEPMAVCLVDHRHSSYPDHVEDFIPVIEHFTDVLIHGNTLLFYS